MNSNDEYQAFAIDEVDSIDRGTNQETMHDISNYIYWYFDKIQVPVIVIHWHFKLFGLVGSKQNLFPILTDLNRFLRKQFSRLTEQIGFTSYFKKLSQFKKLIVEADDALLVAKRTHSKDPNPFHPHQVNDILSFIPKSEAEMFINSVLSPILKLRLADQKQLIELLEQYFAENQLISKAANKLFIHRNTAVYRLKKIEKLLKIDIRKSQDNEQLRLAIKLYLIHY